jgi:hypothetical protein
VKSTGFVVVTNAPGLRRDFAAAGLAAIGVNHYIVIVCGRVIQSDGPLRYAIVDGMNVRDSREHNYPPRWNAARARSYW